VTAAVLDATRRLGALKPWRPQRARLALGAVAAAIGAAQLVAGLAQWLAANEAAAGARPAFGALAGAAAMIALDAILG